MERPSAHAADILAGNTSYLVSERTEARFYNHSYLGIPQGSLDHRRVWIPTCPGKLPLLEEKVKTKAAKRLLSCLCELVTYMKWGAVS